MTKRTLLFLLCLVTAGALRAQSVAFTFDDAVKTDDATRLTPAERNAALLGALRDARVKAALFLTMKWARGAGLELAREWGDAGHLIGNHTITHLYFNSPKVSLEDYEKEVLDCDTVIRDLPGYAKIFRFTFLKEGDTAEKRDGFRAFLKSVGYRPAPVSIDASDWYYNLRLLDRLKKDPGANLEPYRKAYLAHLRDRAAYYDGLSKTILGRSVKHVILLHHNLINALFLPDVIAMFRDLGWTPIDASEAFRDPVYAAEPQILPAGESILWALAKEKGIKGLRYPGEDGEYEKPILDKLGM